MFHFRSSEGLYNQVYMYIDCRKCVLYFLNPNFTEITRLLEDDWTHPQMKVCILLYRHLRLKALEAYNSNLDYSMSYWTSFNKNYTECQKYLDTFTDKINLASFLNISPKKRALCHHKCHPVPSFLLAPSKDSHTYKWYTSYFKFFHLPDIN